MKQNTAVRLDGMVEEALPGLFFKVIVYPREGGEKKEILAHLAGKMKINRIKVIPGDRVIVEIPDLNDRRGRIVRRL